MNMSRGESMKLSEKLQHLKQERAAKQAGAKSGGVSGMFAASTWVLLGLILLLGGVATLAYLEFFVWNKIPPALAGLWEVEEGPRKGGTFEFFRKGVMEVHLKDRKKAVTHKTRVAVRDKTLLITAQDPKTGDETTNEGTIRELTADTLILELERGDVLRMVRVD